MHRRLACSLALLGLFLAACGEPPGTARVDFRHERDPRAGTPVARWEGDAFTREELEARLLEMSPPVRARYQTLAARREYAEGVARFELLVREGLRRDLHQHPEVVEAAKRAIVARLVRDELEKAPAEVTDAEIAASYEAHRDDFQRPERVRLAQVFLAAPREDGPRVKAARARAEALLARARALPADDAAAFGRLAREATEDPKGRALDGDLRFLTEQELTEAWGPELARAARTLEAPGALALVQTRAGWHVVRLTGRQPALARGLADVKDSLRGRLAHDKRQAHYARFLASLAEREQLAFDDAELARVALDPSAPMRPPSGPAPGTVPAPLARP